MIMIIVIKKGIIEIRKNLNVDYLLKEEKVKNTLSEYLGNLGLSQARIAEEIKEESLDYYLDGAREIKIDNCENYILKTNKIEYIEKKPEMKSLNIARLAIKCMENDYDFIIDGYQILDNNGDVDTFVVSECSNYEEQKPKKISSSDELRIRELKENIFMEYFDAETLEEARDIRNHMIKTNQIVKVKK